MIIRTLPVALLFPRDLPSARSFPLGAEVAFSFVSPCNLGENVEREQSAGGGKS